MNINEITPAPWNARKEITPESVKELSASIDAQGLISPITVWKDADGKWLCIAGNRRLAAIRSLHSKGWSGELPEDHYIVFGGDESQAREVTITENLQREGLDILDEAAAVSALLDLGSEPKEVAAKLGKSVTWVRRREKLTALDKAWVKRAKDGEIDADALEHICAYPANVQAAVAKSNGWARHWRDLSGAFDRESRDLDAAKFDTDAADCAACVKRTGAEADLFGVCDGKLGKCLDCHCFDQKMKIWVNSEIAKRVGDAEMVRVKYAWELPSEKETTNRRDKEHPCAYVQEYNGEITVRWGESAKAKKEREAAEEKRRQEEREAESKAKERERTIADCLEAWREQETPKGLDEAIARHLDSDYVKQAAADAICNWHTNEEWAEVLRTFPELAAAAGISEDDAKYFIDTCADDGE